jgi:hypothetical protein
VNQLSFSSGQSGQSSTRNYGGAVKSVSGAVAGLHETDRAVLVLGDSASSVDTSGQAATEDVGSVAGYASGSGGDDGGVTVGASRLGGGHSVAQVALGGGVVGGLAGVQQVGDQHGGQDADDGDDDEQLDEGEALGALDVLHGDS